MSDLITPNIIHDHALGKNDPSSFLFEEYAKTFARLIAESKTATPIVVGVSGKWGSGKTTLLKMIKDHLDSTQHLHENISKLSFVNPTEEVKQFRCCRTVWFNAWKYADEDELLVALVRVIVQEMSKDDLVSQMLSKLLDPNYPRRDVVATLLNIFAIKAPLLEAKIDIDKFKTETPFAKHTALLDQFVEAFDRLCIAWANQSLVSDDFDQTKGVIVVFIDDLDRCLPEKAIQVLEAIKLFLDREGVAFVLAADEDAIRAAIEAHHERSKIKDQRADDYLEKIFQVRFRLPPLSDAQAKNYLADALDIVDPSIKENVKLIVAGAETNPRQIKTFVNYLETGWAVLKNSNQAESVEKTDFLYWLALTRVGEKFCEKVRGLPLDIRINYIKDAIDWANGKTEKAAEYKDWEGFEYRRLRDVLKAIAFSEKVSPRVLDGFIYWNVAEAIEAEMKEKAKIIEAIELVMKERADEKKRQERKSEELASQFAQANDIDKIALTRGGEFKRIAPDPFNPDYWIEIPIGKFVMGSDKGEDRERPQHTVVIPYTYKIARYPVTNADLAKFVASGYKFDKVKNDKPDHPVVWVSWHHAIDYCDWFTKELQAQGVIDQKMIARLPTEAEWEKAARGEYGKEYPWGDEFDVSKCNIDVSGFADTTPVGKFSPEGDSPYGVSDMAGNVWEWCQSKYKPYPYDANDGREKLDGDEARVVRGGSFYDHQWGALGAYRYINRPDFRDYSFGFRVVVSPIF